MQDISLNQYQYADTIGSSRQTFNAESQRSHAVNVPAMVSAREHPYIVGSPYYESLGSNPYLTDPIQSERIIGNQVSGYRQQTDSRRGTYTSETDLGEHKTLLTGGPKVIENKYGLGVRLVDKTPRNSNSNMNNHASSRQHLGSEEFKGLEYKASENRVYTPIKSHGVLAEESKSTKFESKQFGSFHSPQVFGTTNVESNFTNLATAALQPKVTKAVSATETVGVNSQRIITATPSATQNTQKQLLQIRSPTQSVRYVTDVTNQSLNSAELHRADETKLIQSQRTAFAQQTQSSVVNKDKQIIQEQSFAQGSYQQLPTQIVQVQPGQVRQHIQTIANQPAQAVAEVSQWKHQHSSTQQTPAFTPALLQSPQQTTTQLTNLASPKNALLNAKETINFNEQHVSQRLNQLSQISGEIVKIELEGVGSYEGVIRNNSMHGFGKLLDIRGRTVYEGEFSNSQFEGLGILFNYEEGMSQFETHQGSFVPENWIRYEGMFHDNKKNGNGYLFYANGGRFSGEFVNDTPTGPGVLIRSNGDVVRGMWREGRLVTQY